MINLESLADGTISDRNFQKLRGIVLDTGGISLGLRAGASSATWTAAVESANKTIAHGLAKVPVYVGLTGVGTGALLYSVVSKDATNIVIKGRDTRDTNLTGTFDLLWLVIG